MNASVGLSTDGAWGCQWEEVAGSSDSRSGAGLRDGEGELEVVDWEKESGATWGRGQESSGGIGSGGQLGARSLATRSRTSRKSGCPGHPLAR